MDRLTRHAPKMLGLLRIVSALAYMEHGTQKLLHFPAMSFGGPGGGARPGPASAAAGGPPPGMDGTMGVLLTVAAIIETFGGLAILIGFLTRPVAFLVAGELAVVYWWMHAPRSFFPISNMGEALVVYCFVFLYLVFAGPGAFAVDNLLRRKQD